MLPPDSKAKEMNFKPATMSILAGLNAVNAVMDNAWNICSLHRILTIAHFC
jgi:hypothetical protein